MEQERKREFRRLLEREEGRLEETLANLERNLAQSQKDSVQELSSYDQHSTDLAQRLLSGARTWG